MEQMGATPDEFARIIDTPGGEPILATGKHVVVIGGGFSGINTALELAEKGITKGCGSGRYCPNQSVTRAEMASFLVRAFDL